MEHSATFPALLERFQKGDPSVSDALCARLAERLLIVPVHERAEDAQSDAEQQGLLKFSPFERPGDGADSILAFTNPRSYKEWAARNGMSLPTICVFGADLGAALSRPASVVLDEGTPASAKLPETMIEKVASIKPADEPESPLDRATAEVEGGAPQAEESPTALLENVEQQSVASESGAPREAGHEDRSSAREERLAVDGSAAGSEDASPSPQVEPPLESAPTMVIERTVVPDAPPSEKDRAQSAPPPQESSSALRKVKRSIADLFKFS